MKRRFLPAYLGMLILLLLVLTGCSLSWRRNSLDSGRLKVAATIFPIYDILREVGGEKVEATLIVPPGSSPHTFSLAPSVIKKLQKIDLFLAVGGELDSWWARSLNDSLSSREYIELAGFIELQPFTFGHNHESEGEDGEEGQFNQDENSGQDSNDLDPHFWLDPLNAPLIAEQIAAALSRLDPENAEYYQARAEDFSARVFEKVKIWQQILAELGSRELIVFHDAWSYFARRFDLEIVAAFEPFPGKSPGPQYLEGLQQEVINHNIKALFVEPQLSTSAVKAVADDLGLLVAILDPIGGVPERETYFDLIDYNVETISSALSSK